jgi:hypothetical protein
MAADLVYKLYRNERQLPPLKKLPSETFFEHCMTGFEGDEAPPARLPNSTAISCAGRPMSTTTMATTRGARSKQCRNPVTSYSGDRPLEGWLPGAEYAIEPAS